MIQLLRKPVPQEKGRQAQLFEYGIGGKSEVPIDPTTLRILRFHPSGDFYTERYIRAWIQICTSLSEWRFFGYTRSWAIPSLRTALEELAALPNVALYVSIDPSMTGTPPFHWPTSTMSIEKPPSARRCMVEVTLEKAFHYWKIEHGKPITYKRKLSRLADHRHRQWTLPSFLRRLPVLHRGTRGCLAQAPLGN